MLFSLKKVFIYLSVLAVLFLVSSYTIFNQSASGQSCVEPPSGLVSWWNGTREQPTNTTRYMAVDISGGNNGTILSQSGSPYKHPGKVGEAFWFGETTTADFRGIVVRDPAKLNFGTGPFSLEAWFQWESGGKSNINNIIRKSRSAYTHNRDNNIDTSYGTGYWLRINQGTKLLEFFVGDTGDDPSKSRGLIMTSVSQGIWYHVVATRNSSGTMKLYLDGELKGIKEAPNANTTNESLFTIGGWANPDITSAWSTGEIFKGFLDEVSVYNRALSQSEVKAIFNAGSAGKCEKPIPTPEPSKSPTPTSSRPPVSVSPTPAALSDLTYPIGELGNCASQQDCKAYCDISSNFSSCAAFAQKNNLTVLVPAVFTAMQKGESPGQCKDEASCRKYCEDIDHTVECVSFIEKFKLASSDDLKEIRKVADAKKTGVAFPGNCKSKESCMKYCEGATHAVECMEFALKTGLIPKEDVESVSKIVPYLKSGGKLPGGCTTKESCDKYCGNDSHANECVDFAVNAGFMTKEDADIVRKTGGKGPGNCKSREACDAYCKDESHVDECINFAVKAGFISQEDAAMAKKFGITSGGPGGCKSKAECQSFCALPDNQGTCSSWGKEHGIDMTGGGGGGPGNAEECAKYGGNWDGKKCDLGASECVKQGGIWGPDKETGKDGCNFSGGMGGPDIRKEIEDCLAKPTCDEFNSCFNALPKGNQQQSGQEQKQPQDENGKKMQDRAMACLQEKIDSCLGLSCSEFSTCISALNKGGGEKSGQQQSGTPDPAVQAKFQSCQPPKQTGSPSGGGGGDQSGIPGGYSSWDAFCRANSGDSRCARQQQYPLLLHYKPFAVILNFILGH